MDKKAKELLQYRKEDIVEALSRWDFGYHVIPNILYDLQKKRLEELRKEAEDASQQAIDATERYYAWWGEMAKRFGDGNIVRLQDIPQKEFDEGLRLEADLKRKTEKSSSAQERFERFVKEA